MEQEQDLMDKDDYCYALIVTDNAGEEYLEGVGKTFEDIQKVKSECRAFTRPEKNVTRIIKEARIERWSKKNYIDFGEQTYGMQIRTISAIRGFEYLGDDGIKNPQQMRKLIENDFTDSTAVKQKNKKIKEERMNLFLNKLDQNKQENK